MSAPRVVTDEMIETAKQRLADGLSLNAVARELGCSMSALRYHVNEHYRSGQIVRNRGRMRIEMAPLARKRERIPRSCLRCGGGFDATHRTNRLCENCTEFAASTSSALA